MQCVAGTVKIKLKKVGEFFRVFLKKVNDFCSDVGLIDAVKLQPMPSLYRRVAFWLERHLVVDRSGFDSLAESNQNTLKVGIHSFLA